MKNHFRNLLTLTLSICMLTATVSSTTIYGNEITPRYNNTASASLNTTVNSNGTLTISYNCQGYSSATSKIVITTYIEKQFLFFFWTRVDIGTTNNEWSQTINNYRYTGTLTFMLPSTGTYRTTVTYKVYGSGGTTDEITKEDIITY